MHGLDRNSCYHNGSGPLMFSLCVPSSGFGWGRRAGRGRRRGEHTGSQSLARRTPATSPFGSSPRKAGRRARCRPSSRGRGTGSIRGRHRWQQRDEGGIGRVGEGGRQRGRHREENGSGGGSGASGGGRHREQDGRGASGGGRQGTRTSRGRQGGARPMAEGGVGGMARRGEDRGIGGPASIGYWSNN